MKKLGFLFFSIGLILLGLNGCSAIDDATSKYTIDGVNMEGYWAWTGEYDIEEEDPFFDGSEYVEIVYFIKEEKIQMLETINEDESGYKYFEYNNGVLLNCSISDFYVSETNGFGISGNYWILGCFLVKVQVIDKNKLHIAGDPMNRSLDDSYVVLERVKKFEND